MLVKYNRRLTAFTQELASEQGVDQGGGVQSSGELPGRNRDAFTTY